MCRCGFAVGLVVLCVLSRPLRSPELQKRTLAPQHPDSKAVDSLRQATAADQPHTAPPQVLPSAAELVLTRTESRNDGVVAESSELQNDRAQQMDPPLEDKAPGILLSQFIGDDSGAVGASEIHPTHQPAMPEAAEETEVTSNEENWLRLPQPMLLYVGTSDLGRRVADWRHCRAVMLQASIREAEEDRLFDNHDSSGDNQQQAQQQQQQHVPVMPAEFAEWLELPPEIEAEGLDMRHFRRRRVNIQVLPGQPAKITV